MILLRLFLFLMTGISMGAAAVLPPVMPEPAGAAIGAGAAAVAVTLFLILIRTQPSA
jgi:hypothetical protein